MRESRGDGGGGHGIQDPPPPPENSQNKNLKATKPAFNVGPALAHERNAI